MNCLHSDYFRADFIFYYRDHKFIGTISFFCYASEDGFDISTLFEEYICHELVNNTLCSISQYYSDKSRAELLAALTAFTTDTHAILRFYKNNGDLGSIVNALR